MTTNVIDSQIETLTARKNEMVGKAGDYLATCEKESGGMTPTQDAEWKIMHGEIESYTSAIEALDAKGSELSDESKGLKKRLMNGLADGNNTGTGPVFKDGVGNQIQAYTGEQNLSERSIGCDLGDAIQGILRGDALQASVGSTDSAGGYILNPEFSTRFIDLARSASVTSQAGAITVPMQTSEMVIAGLASDPTSHWRGETVPVTSTDVTFNRIVLRAKTLAAIVPVSIEMLEDASNAGQIIEAALRASMGLKLDQAALIGSGAEQNPKGIRNHDGVNAINTVGTPANYSKFSLAIGDIMAANYPGTVEQLAWINHPRTDDTLDGLADTTGQPLQPTPRVQKLRRYSTTSLPINEGGGTDESVSVVGDFSQLVVGMRTRGITIRVLDAGTVTDSVGDSINANTQLMRHIVAYVRADVAVLRPSWFTVMDGITSA
jgi:HK97 family phage major capsid protein